MISILRITTLHCALTNLSNKNWREIEDAYNANAKNSPATMRIEFEHGGNTSDSLQRNAYLLAREYYAHKYHLWQTVNIDTGFFSRRIIGHDQYMALPAEEKKGVFIIIPDQFMQGLQMFRKKWDALETAIDRFTEEFKDEHAMLELRKLFTSQFGLLARNHITHEIIQLAHNEALDLIKKPCDKNKLELEFDWEDLLRLTRHLSNAVCDLSEEYKFNKQTNKLEKVPENPHEKVIRLKGFFVNYLKIDSVITLFKDTLSPQLLLHSKRPQLANHWSTQSLWGEAKTAHAEKFRDTLTAITISRTPR